LWRSCDASGKSDAAPFSDHQLVSLWVVYGGQTKEKEAGKGGKESL